MRFKYSRVLQFNFEDELGYGIDKIRGKDIVNLALSINANTIVIFARDAWGRSFYNSRFMRKIGRLGKRNFLKEVLEEASKYNIAVIPMIGHTTNLELYSRHPDWVQRDRNGKIITMDTDPIHRSRDKFTWPLMCLNSPFLDHVLNELEEVLNYNVDGVFLDSFRYMPDIDKACFCKWCREKYKREHNCELPDKEDFRNSLYRDSFKWRINVNINSIKTISNKLKEHNNCVLVYNNHPLGWRGRANTISELSKDFVDIFFAECSEADYQPPGFISEMVKLTRSLTGKFVWATRNSFHTALTSRETSDIVIRQGLREAFAGGGYPVFLVFASTFINGINPTNIKQVFSEIEKLEEYMDNVDPLPYIGIVFSNRSRDWAGSKLSPHITDSFRGFYHALIIDGFPVNYISDTCLDNNGFNDYKGIVLANTWSLSANSINNLRKYLENGGGIIATYKTGILDENGARLEETRLNEILGISFNSIIKSSWSYLRLNKNHSIVNDINGKYILWGDFDREFMYTRTPPEIGWHAMIKYSKGDVIGHITLTNREYGNEYENGRSPPPPLIDTNMAGIVAEDKWVYFSGQPGRIYWRTGSPNIKKLIINSVKYIAGEPPVRVETQGFAELEAYRRNGQIILHILNHTYPDRIIVRGNTAINTMWASSPECVHPPIRVVPLTDVNIIIRNMEIQRVYEPLKNKFHRFQYNGNEVKIDIPRLNEYMCLVIDVK